MKLYCKNNFLNMNGGVEIPLTIGKCYEKIRKGKEELSVVVVNDNGKESSYSLFRFFNQEEWREYQLNSILNLQ